MYKLVSTIVLTMHSKLLQRDNLNGRLGPHIEPISADMLLNLCYNQYFHVYLVLFIQGSVKAQLERKCEVGNMEAYKTLMCKCPAYKTLMCKCLLFDKAAVIYVGSDIFPTKLFICHFFYCSKYKPILIFLWTTIFHMYDVF